MTAATLVQPCFEVTLRSPSVSSWFELVPVVELTAKSGVELGSSLAFESDTAFGESSCRGGGTGNSRCALAGPILVQPVVSRAGSMVFLLRFCIGLLFGPFFDFESACNSISLASLPRRRDFGVEDRSYDVWRCIGSGLLESCQLVAQYFSTARGMCASQYSCQMFSSHSVHYSLVYEST